VARAVQASVATNTVAAISAKVRSSASITAGSHSTTSGAMAVTTAARISTTSTDSAR